MEQIIIWIKKLAVFIIMVTYMEHLIPDKYRQYFKVCIGLIMILLVAMPMIEYLNNGVSTGFSYLYESFRQTMAAEAASDIGEGVDYYIMAYKNALSSQVRQQLEGEDMVISGVEVAVVENADSADYGKIERITVHVRLQTEDTETESVIKASISRAFDVDRQQVIIIPCA